MTGSDNPGAGPPVDPRGGASSREVPVVFTTPPWLAGTHERVSVFELASVFLKRRRVIIATPVVFALVSTIIVMIVSSRFTAVTSFTPEAKKSALSMAGVAGLAAQFGMALPAMENSALFYSEVLKSRGIRDSILLGFYDDPRPGHKGQKANLLDILEITGNDPGERLENGRDRMRSVATLGVDAASNIVSVSIKTRDARLSADIANRHVDLLNHFNSTARETSGRARREFAESRLATAEQELRDAETAQSQFLQRNRVYERAPDLVVENTRLQRDVRIKEDVLSTLRQQYEQARIEEVNDTPLITIIDRAAPPGKRSSPKRTITVILSTFLGVLVGVFIAFTLEYLDRTKRQDPDHYAEVRMQFRSWIGPKGAQR